MIGQIISKCFFGVFGFFQKKNEKKSTSGIIVVKSNSFVRFLEEIEDTKKTFRNYLTFNFLKKFFEIQFFLSSNHNMLFYYQPLNDFFISLWPSDDLNYRPIWLNLIRFFEILLHGNSVAMENRIELICNELSKLYYR